MGSVLSVQVITPLLLVGLMCSTGCGPFALYLRHPRPGGHFGDPAPFEGFADGVVPGFVEGARNDDCVVLRPDEEARKWLGDIAIEERYDTEGGDRALDTIVLRVGERSFAFRAWPEAPQQRRQPYTRVWWVGAFRDDGRVRLDVVVARTAALYISRFYHHRVCLGPGEPGDYDGIAIGSGPFFRLEGSYLDDGRLQLMTEQEAFWGFPFVLPIPLTPIPLFTIKKKTLLSETEPFL